MICFCFVLNFAAENFVISSLVVRVNPFCLVASSLVNGIRLFVNKGMPCLLFFFFFFCFFFVFVFFLQFYFISRRNINLSFVNSAYQVQMPRVVAAV